MEGRKEWEEQGKEKGREGKEEEQEAGRKEGRKGVSEGGDRKEAKEAS